MFRFFAVLKKLFIHFNWRIITFQYCDDFCHTSTWIGCGYTCVPPSWTLLPPPFPPCPSGLSQSTDSGYPASCIEFTLIIVLHMVMYMFQCYSLKSSHPHLLPLSPKVCSLHLCLLCRPACGIVVTIFLVVQLLSHIRLFVMPWTVACQTFLSFAMSWSLLKLMSIDRWMDKKAVIHIHNGILLSN